MPNFNIPRAALFSILAAATAAASSAAIDAPITAFTADQIAANAAKENKAYACSISGAVDAERFEKATGLPKGTMDLASKSFSVDCSVIGLPPRSIEFRKANGRWSAASYM